MKPPGLLLEGIEKLMTRLRGQTTREIAVVLSGHAIRLGLGLVSSALLARGLTPEGLSVFTVLGAWVTILGTFTDFGLRNSTVRQIAGQLAEDEQNALKFANTFGWLKFSITLSVFCLICLLATPLVNLLKLPRETGLALIVGGGIWMIATAFSGIPATLLQALRKFSPLMVSQTVNVALTVILTGTLFLTHQLTPLSALMIGILTTLAAGVYGFRALPPEWRHAVIRPAKLNREISGQLWQFGKWVWVGTLFAILYVQLDLLMLHRFAAARETGYYALAFNLAQKSFILFQTLYIVLLPQASGLINRQQLRHYLRRNMLYAGLMAGVVGVTMIVARPAITLVYSDVYLPSVNLYLLLALPVIMDLLTLPLFLLIYPLDMPRLEAVGNGLRVMVLLASGWYLIPIWGAYGAALAKILATLVGIFVVGISVIYQLVRHSKFGISQSSE